MCSFSDQNKKISILRVLCSAKAKYLDILIWIKFQYFLKFYIYKLLVSALASKGGWRRPRKYPKPHKNIYKVSLKSKINSNQQFPEGYDFRFCGASRINHIINLKPDPKIWQFCDV